jgi:hypothetical protein
MTESYAMAMPEATITCVVPETQKLAAASFCRA